MTDALDIEVVGRPPPTEHRREGATPSWGMPVAVAVAGVLLLAVLVVTVVPAVRSAGVGHARSATPTETTGLNEPHSEILGATGAALAAWGRFATTGDVTALSGHFQELGPQYRQLVEEGRAIAAAPRTDPGGYRVVTSGTVEEVSAERAQVRAIVVWHHAVEIDQRMTWLIELHPTPRGSWAVWTVRTA